MQYVTTRPVLNVEECDRLSFMPWMFGADFMLAESQVYALAKQWMPEYSSEFWHFIRLPEGGGYMMPDCGRVHLVSTESWFDRTVSQPKNLFPGPVFLRRVLSISLIIASKYCISCSST